MIEKTSMLAAAFESVANNATRIADDLGRTVRLAEFVAR
jgi:hypothetical protein